MNSAPALIAMVAPALAGLVGACAGSFAATAVVRAQRAEPFLRGRSHCDGCALSLGFAETLPVVSFAWLRGACPACGARIDPLHPVGEISGALIAASAVAGAPNARGALFAVLGLVLLASALTDARTRRLPDLLTLTIAALGLAAATLRGEAALITGLVASAAGFLILEGVRRGFLALRRRPGLGFGDVKLVAALALWLGAATPWAVALAAALGLAALLIARPADGRIAFGPALAAGAWVVGLSLEAGAWPF
jgi:leader peptidase (prepilin peptidase)/N-methyltransferase